MKSKPKHFTVPLVVYPIEIVVSLCEGLETVAAYMEWTVEFLKMEENEVAKTYYKDGKLLIRFTCYPRTPEEKGDEAHEVFHAVCYAMDYVGMKFTGKSEEAYSYLIDYVTTEIEKGLK